MSTCKALYPTLALGLLAAPLGAEGQQPGKAYRLGIPIVTVFGGR